MYLTKTTGALLPGRGLINPAFVIKIVPATDNMQQQPTTGRDNPNNDYLDNLAAGSDVEAKVGKEVIHGKVERIIRNEIGDGLFVLVRDSTGKTHKIEGSQIKVTGNNIGNVDQEKLVSSPAIFNESRLLSFKEFLST